MSSHEASTQRKHKPSKKAAKIWTRRTVVEKGKVSATINRAAKRLLSLIKIKILLQMRSFTLASLAAATVSSHMMDIVANGNRGEHD